MKRLNRHRRKRARPGSKTRAVVGSQGIKRTQVTVEVFMASRDFLRGFNERRAGLTFDYTYVDANPRRALRYETGRQFAVLLGGANTDLYRRLRRWTRFAVGRLTAALEDGSIRP